MSTKNLVRLIALAGLLVLLTIYSTKPEWTTKNTELSSILVRNVETQEITGFRVSHGGEEGIIYYDFSKPNASEGGATNCILSCEFFWNKAFDGMEYRIMDNEDIVLRYDPDLWQFLEK